MDNEIEKLLQPCRTATSQEALGAALDMLTQCVPKLPMKQRERVASFLVHDVVLIGKGSIVERMDACLEACGLYVVLSKVCVPTLLDAATGPPDTNPDSPPSALQSVLRTVRRILLTIPESSTDALSDPSDFLMIRLMQDFETCCFGVDSNAVDVARSTLPRTPLSRIQGLVTKILLLPVQIAAACHAQDLILPAWAAKTRFCPRLVRCTVMATISAASNKQHNHNTATEFTTALIQKIALHGATNHVATGLHQCFDDVQLLDATDMLGQLVFRAFESISTPRDVVTLMKSILQHLLSTMEETPQTNQDWVDATCRERIVPYLLTTCQPILESSRDIQEAWIRLVVLCNVLPLAKKPHQQRLVPHSVALVLAQCCDNQEQDDSDDDHDDAELFSSHRVLWRGIHEVAETWSQSTYVQRTDVPAQRHATRFLQSALSILPKADAPDLTGSAVILNLLNGVTIRLESGVHEIRTDGMRVAEQVAILLDQPPLHFDELDGERERDGYDVRPHDNDSKTPANGPGVQNDPAAKTATTKRVKPRRIPKKKVIDPDAEYQTDDEESTLSSSDDESDKDSLKGKVIDDEDSIWDDNDDELVPYSLEDDEEDLRETPRPLYLRDCLALLRAPDGDETADSQQETALQEVEKLVRSRPPDLPDYAVPLANQLLHMENNFNLENFTEMRQAGLVALAAEIPWPVGESLIEQLFGSIALGKRMDILHTLEEAAYELSGTKELKKQREKTKQLSDEAFDSQPRVAGKRSLVADTSEVTTANTELAVHAGRAIKSMEGPRTRRWGQGRRQTKSSATVSNRFGPVAPMLFYALMRGFISCKDEASIWGGANGSHLLASFLVTLAVVVECSGNHPGTNLLAKDLFDLAWSFRYAEAPQVRMSVLVAIANSVPFLPDHVLMNVLYGDGVDSLVDFLCTTTLEDADETCRRLAGGLSKTLSKTVGAIEGDYVSMAPST